MSVAPRGSRVWQPPTVWIMYCSFNQPAISNYLPQSVHVLCCTLLKRENEKCYKRNFSGFIYKVLCCVVYYIGYIARVHRVILLSPTMANNIGISGEGASEERYPFSFLVAPLALYTVSGKRHCLISTAKRCS